MDSSNFSDQLFEDLNLSESGSEHDMGSETMSVDEVEEDELLADEKAENEKVEEKEGEMCPDKTVDEEKEEENREEAEEEEAEMQSENDKEEDIKEEAGEMLEDQKEEDEIKSIASAGSLESGTPNIDALIFGISDDEMGDQDMPSVSELPVVACSEDKPKAEETEGQAKVAEDPQATGKVAEEPEAAEKDAEEPESREEAAEEPEDKEKAAGLTDEEELSDFGVCNEIELPFDGTDDQDANETILAGMSLEKNLCSESFELESPEPAGNEAQLSALLSQLEAKAPLLLEAVKQAEEATASSQASETVNVEAAKETPSGQEKEKVLEEVLSTPVAVEAPARKSRSKRSKAAEALAAEREALAKTKRLEAETRKEEEKEEIEMHRFLLSHFSEEQWNRYEMYRRSTFDMKTVKRIMQGISGATVSQNAVIAMAGISKIFAGEVMETALDVRDKLGATGPVSPKHLREAVRRLRQEGKVPVCRH